MQEAALLFLSHASEDLSAATDLARSLEQAGLRVWLDAEQIRPGKRWLGEIEQALAQARALMVYVGRGGVGGWVASEVQVALQKSIDDPSFRVIPILGAGADPASLGPFLSQHQWLDLRGGGLAPAELEGLVGEILAKPGEATSLLPSGRSPFLGLSAFDLEDAVLFFGRDREVEELLDRMRVGPFVAVVGASGSGKSSLVRAGLVPALHRGRLGEGRAERWRVAIVRPGRDPLHALASAIPELDPDLPFDRRIALVHDAERHIRAGAEGLRTCLAALPRGARTLLVVDQFEELFTLSHDAEQQLRFVDALLQATGGTTERPVQVIVTLRNDLYARVWKHHDLPKHVAGNQYAVGGMSRAQLRDVIVKPLGLARARLEPGLAEKILDDAGEEPASLALLEHALFELWRRRADSLLTHVAYDEIGRLGGALQRYADATYEQLEQGDREIARQLLIRLVQPGESAAEDTRRPASKTELLGSGDAGPARARVLQALVDKRLLTTQRAADRDDESVEIAHEVLIRGWPKLQEWVQSDRAALRIERRLLRDVDTWIARGRDAEKLTRGSELQEAEGWAAARGAGVPPEVREFLTASRADAQRKAAAEKALEDREAAEELHERLRRQRQAGVEASQADAVAERAFTRARVAIRASLAVAGVFLLWMMLAPRQGGIVDAALTPLVGIGALAINRFAGAHMAGRVLWSLAGVLSAVAYISVAQSGSEQALWALLAIVIFGLMGWVVDAATARPRRGRVLLPLLALAMCWIAPPDDAPSLATLGLLAVWSWVVPAGAPPMPATESRLRAAQSRWLRSLAAAALTLGVALSALALLLSPVGEEMRLSSAIEELRTGVSAETNGPVILTEDRKGFYWPLLSRLLSETDLRTFSVYMVPLQTDAALKQRIVQTVVARAANPGDVGRFEELARLLAPFRVETPEQFLGSSKRIPITHFLQRRPVAAAGASGPALFAESAFLAPQADQGLRQSRDEARSRAWPVAALGVVATVLLRRRGQLAAVRWAAVALIGGVAFYWRSQAYLLYLEHRLWLEAFDDQQVYRLLMGAVGVGMFLLEWLSDYFVLFSGLWVLLCWPPSRPQSGLRAMALFWAKLAIVAVAVWQSYGLLERIVPAIRPWVGASAGLVPTIGTTALYLGVGGALRRRWAHLSELPQLPPSAIVAYLSVVAITAASEMGAHRPIPWLAAAFCLSAVLFMFRLGFLDAGNPRDLRYLLLPTLPPAYTVCRGAAMRLLAPTPFDAEPGRTLLTVGLLVLSSVAAGRLLPLLSRFLTQRQVRPIQRRIEEAKKALQGPGAVGRIRALLEEVTSPGLLLYARGPFGGFFPLEAERTAATASELALTERFEAMLLRRAGVIDLEQDHEWEDPFHTTERQRLARATGCRYLVPMVQGPTLQCLFLLPASTPEPWRFDRAVTREISRLANEVTSGQLAAAGRAA